jgi:hypothetical protein
VDFTQNYFLNNYFLKIFFERTLSIEKLKKAKKSRFRSAVIFRSNFPQLYVVVGALHIMHVFH